MKLEELKDEEMYVLVAPDGTAQLADIYCLPIPDKYAQVSIDPVFNELYWWSHEGIETTIPLPQGNWQIICTTKEVKAMHAPALFGHAMISDHCAQKTIRSLLANKGLDPNKNYIIIKKS